MATRLKTSISATSLRRLQKEIEDYKKKVIRFTKELSVELSKIGIDVAKARISDSGYAKYVTFETKISENDANCRAVIIAKDINIIISKWQTKEGVQTRDISPVLMLEFGSGTKAENPLNIQGVGQGTYPPGGHGNEDGWYFMDLDGNWHYASGVSPKMPMFNAIKEIKDVYLKKAKELFNK